MPPSLESVLQAGPRPGYALAGKYRTIRGAYSVYAGLSSDRLRKLHREHELTIKFQDLPPADRQRLADAIDQDILWTNQWYGSPLDLGRPPQLRKLLYGITKVRLVYAHSDPSCKYASPQGGNGFESFPRPYRVVFLHFDSLGAGRDEVRRGVTQNPPLSHFNRYYETTYLIAWPTEIQQSVMRWSKAWADYRIKLMVKISPDGYVMQPRPGAPPPPTNPWAYFRYQK